MFTSIRPKAPTRLGRRSLLLVLICGVGSVLLFGHILGADQNATPRPQDVKRVRVYVAGIGTTPYIQDALDEVTDFLVEKKVLAKQLAESDGKTRNQLAARVKELGGENLLYLSLDLEKGASYILKAQCVNAEGDRLWEDEAAGPMIATSTASAVKSRIKKMQKKLEGQIGKNCLPVAE